MQTRRDHLHAYQFATGRLASALITGDPGTGEPPMRRGGLGAVFGIMLAGLLVLAALVYGYLKPVDNNSWAHNGALIVEKETGTRYFYADGRLHPTANYASALLAAGGNSGVEDVSRASLAKVPRGSTIGIPNAPDDVAGADALLTGPWTDCLRPGAAVGETLNFLPTRVKPLPATTHVLVEGPHGARYLLRHGVKYPISVRSAFLALGLDTEQPVQATTAWLDDLPTGTAIAPAKISGAGSGGSVVAGRAEPIGTLMNTVVSGTDHYYVLTSDGVAPLTATESALLAAEPDGRRPLRVSPTDLASLPSSPSTLLMHRIPDMLSDTNGTDDHSALCLLQSLQGSRLQSALVRESDAAATSNAGVLVPPERGVLAESPKNPTAAKDPEPFLISDQGVKYQLSSNAVSALGYGGDTPRVLPQSVLDQVRTGPTLTRESSVVAVPGAN